MKTWDEKDAARAAMAVASRKAQAILRRKKSEAWQKALKRVLTDDEVRARLQLTEADLKVLNDTIQMKGPRRDFRYVGAQMAALKMKILATVKPPEQTVRGEMAVQVVVNTLRKPDYELPVETTSVALPEDLDA
jgi:hypothetical protein